MENKIIIVIIIKLLTLNFDFKYCLLYIILYHVGTTYLHHNNTYRFNETPIAGNISQGYGWPKYVHMQLLNEIINFHVLNKK